MDDTKALRYVPIKFLHNGGWIPVEAYYTDEDGDMILVSGGLEWHVIRVTAVQWGIEETDEQ